LTTTAAATVTALDGTHLADALRAGIYRLFARTDHLNKINVFPVPDGDTGTNMSMTCSAVLAVIQRERSAHAGTLLTRIADAAIDGARGNSGAILAQFLLGLGDKLGHLAEIKLTEFTAALRGGAQYARNAIVEPREGTILTVLTAFATAAERNLAGGTADFRGLFQRSLEHARTALSATRKQLAQLESANVVDAGAEGFVTLIEGMSDYFATGDVGTPIDPRSIAIEEAAPAAPEDSRYRFCTECLVMGDALDLRRMREELSALGTSLVIAGSACKARVHLHTNDPQQLFDQLARHGAVSGQKADDMLLQQHAAHHARSQRVVVVSDSAADWPDDAAERLELHMVPVRVHFGPKSYLDKVSLTPQQFYHELVTNPNHPKTSQPPPGDFRRMYEFLLSHFHSVVNVCLTSKVSGTYNAAVTAAQRVSTERIAVVDSGTVSLGQGMLAVYAAECAQAGYTQAEVLAALERARARTITVAVLSRLDYAVRGGRVPKAIKPIADFLRLAPILVVKPDGRVTVGGALLGRHDLARRIARRLRRQMTGTQPYRVWVGHANTPELATQMLAALTDGGVNIESQHAMAVGTALGAHGGPGMLVAAIQAYEKPVPKPGAPAN
jgi:DegV family protein with EDD domain